MQVVMLGPVQVTGPDGATVELGGARLRVLLARLALDAGQILSTDVLIDGLWGERPPSDATNALQSLVSRLRRGLRGVDAEPSLLESKPAGYRLAVDRDDVDVHRFERLARQGRDDLLAGQPRQAVDTLRAGLGLWRGQVLADLGDASFAEPVRGRLDELHVAAREDLLDAELQLGHHHEAIAELGVLTAEHPLRERAAALYVTALYQAGRQADALAAYETIRRALDAELGVQPSTELQDVQLRVLRRDPGLAPQHSEQPELRRPRVPVALTSFVGRDHELDEILRALTDSRLATLLGPGGAGKTRLATEVASGQRVDATAVFVELAGIGDSADIVTAVLTALGLRDVVMLENRPAQVRQIDPVDRLVDALSARPALLILDNCEHLVGGAAALSDELLSRCPALRILATSREPLAITGEAIVPVGPLQLPDDGAALEQIRASAAVRMFTDRAVAVRPGFAVDESSGLVLAEICRKLDGLPLALELAAARLRSMTLNQIIDRLDDRFRLLTGGSRTSLPRHRTLRAVVEWSWDLLEKPELILARRLSVFPAGATLESATAVCADDELPAADILYVLASLVEKSLVEAGEGRDGQPRYRMLETVRAFGAERLAESGEADRIRAAFCASMLDLSERAEPHLRGAEQVQWLQRMFSEQDNIVAAARHAADSGDSDTATRITVSCGWYWMITGRHGEVIALAEHALALDGPAPADAHAVLVAFSRFGRFAGIPDRGEMAELRDLLESTNAMARYPMLAMLEPLLSVFSGDWDAVQRSLRRAAEHPDSWARSAGQLGQAFITENEGRAAETEQFARAALDGFRQLGDRWGQAMALRQLSERYSLLGDAAAAIGAYDEAIRLTQEMGASDELPEQYARLAMQRLRSGDVDGAEQGLHTARQQASAQGATDVLAVVACGFASVSRMRGDLDGARRKLAEAADLFTSLAQGFGHFVAMIASETGAIAVADGDADTAAAEFRRAMVALADLPDMPVAAAVGDRFAEVLYLRDDPEGAARCIGWCTAVRGTADLGNAELVEFRARIAARIGEQRMADAVLSGSELDRDSALAALCTAMGVDESCRPSRRS